MDPLAIEGWTSVSEQVVNRSELFGTEFYNDYLRPNGVAHAAWSIPDNSNGIISSLGVYRGPKKGTFEADSLRTLKFLTPHVKRAILLHSSLSNLKAELKDLRSALDALAHGVLLIGPGMKVVALNGQAERFVDANDGLRIVRGHLRAECSSERALLESLLTAAIATSESRGLKSAGSMLVSRHCRPPLRLQVTPVRGLEYIDPSSARAIVFTRCAGALIKPSTLP